MHVLTKIFIVLLSLLSVLLVPLVVVFAHNEDSYKEKYQSASVQAAAANQNFHYGQLAHAQREADLDLQIRDLMSENGALAQQRESSAADLRRLQIDLAESRSQQSGIRADINTISSAVATGQDLIDSLLTEVRTIRSEAVSAERRAVELDEALRDMSGQLDSAVAARRAMQRTSRSLAASISRSRRRPRPPSTSTRPSSVSGGAPSSRWPRSTPARATGSGRVGS